MIDQEPIFIAGPPRSGTTMTAGLLFHHGVWIGRARTTFFPESNSNLGVENMDIKDLMKREARKVSYKNWCIPLPTDLHLTTNYASLKREIESFVPDKIPWLVKTSWTLTFNSFWKSVYPKARWVLTMRPDFAILDSMNRHPGMRRRPQHMKKQFVKALKERQRQVFLKVKHSLSVDVKEISKGNESEIAKLFDFVGIVPNWDVIEQWIEPGKMQ